MNKDTAKVGVDYRRDNLSYNVWYTYEIAEESLDKIETDMLMQLGKHLSDNAKPSERLYALAQIFERIGL